MRPGAALILTTLIAVLPSLGAEAARTAGEAPEWTLEQARQCWQTMVRPVQHVGVPGYQFQAGVLWDGALVFGPLDFRQLKVMQAELASLGDSRLHVSIGYGDPMRLVDRRGTGHPAIRRFLEEGRLPIPHVVTQDGGLSWDQTVFAHLLDRELDAGMSPGSNDVLVVQTDFYVRNTGQARRTGHLWLHFGDTSQVRLGYKCGQGDELAPPIAHRYEAPFGKVGDHVRYVLPTPDQGEIRWHDELPPLPETKSAPRRVIEWRVTLAPGDEARLRLLLPYGLIDANTAQRLTRLDSRGELEKVRGYWRKLEHGPGQILTPDPFVNDYLAAVVGQMGQQIAYRAQSGVWMYKTSPNHYEGYWPCNAAKALPTLDWRGLSALNRPVLQSFVAQQTDDVRGMVNQTLAFLEAGMPKGQGAYFSAHHTALAEARGRRPSADANWADISDPAADRHTMWRHYVEYETMWPIGGPLFLARDDLPRYFEWLFHNLAVVLHPDWRVGVESLDGVPSCAPGDGERWQCIRKMFVHERDGYDGSPQSLWLLQALPRSWLRPNDRLAVRDMGTLFGGTVNLDVKVAADGGSVQVHADWRNLAVLPRRVVMRLRSGNGKPLRSAEINGASVKVLPGDLIEWPATTQNTWRILGRFE